ncbi:MAG: hypothetical protein C0168_06455 [Candidatus Aminicenantes bacterium]|nr:MAG: hypothetical protein C0168_06455 [Candidatus Aminicenantes bacterium]
MYFFKIKDKKSKENLTILSPQIKPVLKKFAPMGKIVLYNNQISNLYDVKIFVGGDDEKISL